MGDLDKVLANVKEHYPAWSEDDDYDARFLLGAWGEQEDSPTLSGRFVRAVIREAGIDPYEQIPFRPVLEDYLSAHVPLEEEYPTPPKIPWRNDIWAEPEEPTHYVLHQPVAPTSWG